jgi:hypothetical protein
MADQSGVLSPPAKRARVPASSGPVADKGVGGDGAAASVINVARRQHRALVECLGLQHAARNLGAGCLAEGRRLQGGRRLGRMSVPLRLTVVRLDT